MFMLLFDIQIDHFASVGKMVCFREVTKMYQRVNHCGDAAGMVMAEC